MKDNTKYVGLDVSKEKIAVGIADTGRGASRYWGSIPHTRESIRKLMDRLGEEPDQMEVCYEAGPTGYDLYRQLTEMGIHCIVVAPTLIPQRSGDRVKTDRRDALRLAELLRAGELTAVHVPTEEHEALRDVVRAREDAKEDLLRARHRLSKFLLRQQLRPPHKTRTWSPKHRLWLDSLKFENSTASQTVFQEYLHHLDEISQRIGRLDAEIHTQAEKSPQAPVIQSLQALRGVAEVTAVTLVAEVGNFSRFQNPRQLMAYAGVVPREYSSGGSRWQGRITKTGNAHLRRVIIESSWSYRYPPAVKRDLKKRQESQDPKTLQISWKAQHRLNKKYVQLVMKGKSGCVAATAVARELLGFIWAIACEAEKQLLPIAVN